MSWGSFFYAFSVLALPMEVELGWSRPATMMAMSLALVVAGLLAPTVGHAIDRGHGRRVMTCGSILGAAMLLIWSASSAKPLLYAAWTGLGAAQAMTFSARSEPRRVGKACVSTSRSRWSPSH